MFTAEHSPHRSLLSRLSIRLQRLFAALILLFTASLSPLPAFADSAASGFSENELKFLNSNDIVYYNPYAGICADYSTDPDAEPPKGSTGSLTRQQAEFVAKWHDLVEKLSIEYGIPWEIAMAQGVHESASGTSHIARVKNNLHGVHAFDGRAFETAYAYSDFTNGWIGYFHNLVNTSSYANKGLFKGEAVTNPYAALKAIAAAGYASDPNYIAKNSVQIAKVIKLAQEQGWRLSSELATMHPEMQQNAATISSSHKNPYQRKGSGSLKSPYHFNYVGLNGRGDGEGILSNSDLCVYGAGNGSINDIALQLAWDTRQGRKVKPEYEAAMKQVGAWDGLRGASCDHFVCTVMRYSGADPKYPVQNVQRQIAYMKSHPELYQNLGPARSTDNFQPGDIFTVTHHTMIYVRLPDGKEGIASASIGSRTGDLSTPVSYIFSDPRGPYTHWRYIGTTAHSTVADDNKDDNKKSEE